MKNLTPTVIDGRTAIVSLFDFSHYFLIVLKANDIQGPSLSVSVHYLYFFLVPNVFFYNFVILILLFLWAGWMLVTEGSSDT